jgi:hypothetical protein
VPQLPADVPLAVLGAVVTAAGVLRWRQVLTTAPWPLAGPPLLFAAALDQQGSWRAPVALAAAVALVATGVVRRPRTTSTGRDAEPAAGQVRAQRLLLATAALMALAGPGIRALIGARTGTPSARVLAVEAWSLPASVVVGVAVLAHVRTWPADIRTAGADPRRWGLVPVVVTAALPTLLAVDTSMTGLVRAVGVLAVGAGLALTGAVAEGRRRRVAGLGVAAAAALTWAARGGRSRRTCRS